MRGTLEKLAQERREKEQELARRLDEIKQKGQADRLAQNAASLEPILSRLRELLKKEQERLSSKRPVLSRLSLTSGTSEATSAFHEQVFLLLREQQNILL